MDYHNARILAPRSVARPSVNKRLRINAHNDLPINVDVSYQEDFVRDRKLYAALDQSSHTTFDPHRHCSSVCYMLHGARTTNNPWSESELKRIQKSANEMSVWSERAPCMIALSPLLKRNCSEVFQQLERVKVSIQFPRSRSRVLPQRGKTRSVQWWHEKTDATLLHENTLFMPCNHLGECATDECTCGSISHDEKCDLANCDCKQTAKVMCEKTCRCASNCPYRFRGCSCAKFPGGSCASETCECRMLERECDADLCGSCGAGEILNPVNRNDDEITKGRCQNVSIQRGIPARTLLGDSQAVGFGLYTGEHLSKNQFIGEYKGEDITNGEEVRRGSYYSCNPRLYTFGVCLGDCLSDPESMLKLIAR